MNFSNFYNNYIEIINEDLLTSLTAKLGTSIANIFRKRKKINISIEYIKFFQPLTLEKYDEAMIELNKFYLGESVPKVGKNRPKIYVKDIRQASITGPLFSSIIADVKSGFAGGTTGAQKSILSKIPDAADPNTERDLYKSKTHQIDVSVYLLSNGGKISLWNVPKTGTDPESNFNANNRVYAIGIDNSGLRAFEVVFGMSIQNWLVSKQYADIKKEKEFKKEEREKTWVEIVELNKNLYNKVINIVNSDVFKKNIEKSDKIPPSDIVDSGNTYLFKNPRGWMGLYKTKDGKYKASFTSQEIRDAFNKINYEVQIPSGEKVVAPENLRFKNFYLR